MNLGDRSRRSIFRFLATLWLVLLGIMIAQTGSKTSAHTVTPQLLRPLIVAQLSPMQENRDRIVDPPLDLTPLQPEVDPTAYGVVTATNISQTGLTIPSLWWAREQFGGKLLDNWLAYPPENQNPGRVDLIVNRQVWSLLDYLQRYEFVNHFGISAKDYGYNTRVFNWQGVILAAYTCNFDGETDNCRIWLDSSGFQGRRDPFLQR